MELASIHLKMPNNTIPTIFMYGENDPVSGFGKGIQKYTENIRNGIQIRRLCLSRAPMTFCMMLDASVCLKKFINLLKAAKNEQAVIACSF